MAALVACSCFDLSFSLMLGCLLCAAGREVAQCRVGVIRAAERGADIRDVLSGRERVQEVFQPYISLLSIFRCDCVIQATRP
jgi:hypothetical protein